MSETPRTDAAAWNGRDGECVWAGDMRKLELDYVAALGRVKELEARVSFYESEVPSIAHEYARAHLPEHG